MADFKYYLESEGYSNQSIKSYEKSLLRFISYCDGEGLESDLSTYKDLLNYVQFLQKRKLQPKSIQREVQALKNYFNWLIQTGQRQDHPCRELKIAGVKKQILQRILKMDELEKLYQDYELLPDEPSTQMWYRTAYLSRKRNKVILGLMIYQGLSSADLGRLSEKDLRLMEGKIYVPGSRKSNERELDLQAPQIMPLLEYKEKIRPELLTLNKKKTIQLLVSSGKSQSIQAVLSKLVEVLRKQDKKVVSLQQIRSSLITYWLQKHDLRQTQYLAGHKYVSSTEAYQVNDLEGMQDQVNRFHPL